MLKSRRVVPGRLLAGGFEFEYPHRADAARERCGRVRAMGSGRMKRCGSEQVFRRGEATRVACLPVRPVETERARPLPGAHTEG